MSAPSIRLVVAIGLVITGVGMLDAILSDEWDFFVVFALSGATHATILARLRASRTPVTLRADLARWIDARAERAGERPERVLDRAVAAHRFGFDPGGSDPDLP